ncbi:MAG TPA: hypothetical protein VE861_14470 [Gemmatimonadaceae bacterium]|nr:hypothetical protein [Gemmatimonadaceae bacterium]
MPLQSSDISIRELSTVDDYDACVALQRATWGADFAERVPGAILRVSQKLGGVAAGAFAADRTMLGFVFGMTGIRHGALVHWSDMLAVRQDARGSGLGARLKAYQRDAVRALGVTEMLWTADPLVARNAHFNINHLGARPVEYVENMYGANTGSLLHGAMPTDRFVYQWALQEDDGQPGAPLPHDEDESPVHDAIVVDADGMPRLAAGADAGSVRIVVPDDLTAVQVHDPALAHAWRMTVRAAITGAFARGLVVTRFTRAQGDRPSCYLLSRNRTS